MALKIAQLLDKGAVAILDALGDAVSIQDTSLKVIYQNRQHIRLMGDQAGKQCYEGYQGRDSVCPDCHLLTAFREGRTNRRTVSTNHSRGGLIYAEITSSPLRDADGTIVAGIETVRNVTEQKLRDERLKAITCDLEQNTWKLMAANKELEAFSYTLSHDMKNYLARIEMAAEALTGQAADFLDDSGGFLLDSITASCSAMDETIEAILRLSSTGRGSLTCEEVDLGGLAEDVAADLRAQYPDHPVSFVTVQGIAAHGDRQLFKVMLRNLLANAWKYTRGVPAAAVSFTLEDHENKKVFAVRDNGAGFDMNEAGQLFKPFSRLSSSVGKEGSGIGLATVKRVLLCHDGEIWAEGIPGRGATFYFALPVPLGAVQQK